MYLRLKKKTTTSQDYWKHQGRPSKLKENFKKTSQEKDKLEELTTH